MFAEKLDQAIQEIKTIQSEARQKPAEEAIQAKFPVLVARIPQGWTGPKAWEGTPIEGGFRAHQVPIPVDAHHMEHVDSLLSWLQSYRPEELFDESGKIVDEIAAISPKGDRRMSMNPITNAGIVKAMDTADWKKFCS